MIAAWLEDCEYAGCELSPLTFGGLDNLSGYIGFNTNIHNKSCLEVEWPESDLIMTSPPFYDVEKYIGGDQPWQHCTRQNWIDEFVVPFVAKINGRCALYLDARTKDDYEMVRKFDKIIIVNNKRHPRQVSGVELLCIYN